MEAMRILKETGTQPRRTIRPALHFGALKKPDSSVHGRMFVTRLEVSTMKAVNLNMISYRSTSIWIGTAQGGIYLQGNDLVRSIFEAWMKPFHDVGMTYLASWQYEWD